MAEPNDFDLFIGLILARLYEARPQRLDLEARDFIETNDEISIAFETRAGNWSNTMIWLMDEGYIRSQTVLSGTSSFRFMRSELSEKGFRALNAIPKGLEQSVSSKSTGNKLVDLAKQGGWKAGGKLAERGGSEGASAIADFVQGLFT